MKYTTCFTLAPGTFKFICSGITVIVLEHSYCSDGWWWLVCGGIGCLKTVISNSNVSLNQVDNINDWVYGVMVIDTRAYVPHMVGTLRTGVCVLVTGDGRCSTWLLPPWLHLIFPDLLVFQMKTKINTLF